MQVPEQTEYRTGTHFRVNAPNTDPSFARPTPNRRVRDLSPTASDMANEDVEVGLIGPAASQKEACAAGPALFRTPKSSALRDQCGAGGADRGAGIVYVLLGSGK